MSGVRGVLAVLDHQGVLAPADVREAGDCLWFGSVAQAGAFLLGYARGRTSLVSNVDGDAEFRAGAEYGATRGEEGPMLTLWFCSGDDSRAEWERVASTHDAYPDRRLFIGPRGGVRRESC